MSDLGTDQLFLLKEGNNYPDLTLVCEGGKQFQVHRFVLASRSVVFKTMFEVDMRERATGTVDMKNCDETVVSALINYLYSDKIPKNFTNLIDLLQLAHRYQVSSLVDQCSKRLIKEVTAGNLIKIGTLAENLKLEKLSEKCAQFLVDNFKDLDPVELDLIPSSLFRKSLGSCLIGGHRAWLLKFMPSGSQSFGKLSYDLVYGLIESSKKEEGISRHSMISQCRGKLTQGEVERALNFLSDDGEIYSTIDEDHFKTIDGL